MPACSAPHEKIATGYAADDARRLGEARPHLCRRAASRTTCRALPARPQARRATCFVYMIAGAKVRAPAAAMALIERVRP